jgi:hypothetical protein
MTLNNIIDQLNACYSTLVIHASKQIVVYACLPIMEDITGVHLLLNIIQI